VNEVAYPLTRATCANLVTALRKLVTRLADVAERIRARMDRLGEIDLATQDVLVEVVRDVEKQLVPLACDLNVGVSFAQPTCAPSRVRGLLAPAGGC